MLKPAPVAQVADGKLYSVALGAPKKENSTCPADRWASSRVCALRAPALRATGCRPWRRPVQGWRLCQPPDSILLPAGERTSRSGTECHGGGEARPLCVERASSWFPLEYLISCARRDTGEAGVYSRSGGSMLLDRVRRDRSAQARRAGWCDARPAPVSASGLLER